LNGNRNGFAYKSLGFIGDGSLKSPSAVLRRAILRCDVALLRLVRMAQRAWHLVLFAVPFNNQPHQSKGMYNMPFFV
jgi:hypothetical protein